MPTPAERMYPGGPSSELGNTKLAQAEQKLPEMSKEDWDAWLSLPTKKGRVYADEKHRDLPSMLKNNPDGFVVHKGNRGIKSLPEGVEILSIPGDDTNLFVRPGSKPPLIG